MTAAIIGKNYVLSATFTNADGTPFTVSKPVTYKVFSFNEDFILEGSAIQSQTQPQEWYANIVIPEGAPVPNDMVNQQYHIDWYAENTIPPYNAQMKATEYFQVLNVAEPLSYDSAIALLVNQPFRDTLMTQFPVEEFEVSIMDENNKVYFSDKITNIQSSFANNCYVTNYDAGVIKQVTDQQMGICPYLVTYNYKTAQGIETEVHTLYMVSGKAMVVVNNMRRYLDKARNHDVDPSLRWTDVELIHFVVAGLNRFNVSAPTITGYTISNFPTNFIYLVEKCAEHEALNALYLAEGMRAFDFQGASVQLNVDRTQYLQTKMDEIGSWLDNNLEKSKALLIRTTQGNGLVGIGLSSLTNGRWFGNHPALLRALGYRGAY